jgi:hypothetical protein
MYKNFRYHETCDMRKWEKVKEKGQARIEAVKLCCLDRRIYNPSCPIP